MKQITRKVMKLVQKNFNKNHSIHDIVQVRFDYIWPTGIKLTDPMMIISKNNIAIYKRWSVKNSFYESDYKFFKLQS